MTSSWRPFMNTLTHRIMPQTIITWINADPFIVAYNICIYIFTSPGLNGLMSNVSRLQKLHARWYHMGAMASQIIGNSTVFTCFLSCHDVTMTQSNAVGTFRHPNHRWVNLVFHQPTPWCQGICNHQDSQHRFPANLHRCCSCITQNTENIP